MSAFFVVGPDAAMSTWIWHPSLFSGAISLLIAAGIRLRSGSRWWASVVVVIPWAVRTAPLLGVRAIWIRSRPVGPSRCRWSDLAVPVLTGLAVALVAWIPFLLFENRRGWSDFRTIANATDAHRSVFGKLLERLHEIPFVLVHLGRGLHSRVHLTPLILAGALGALWFAVRRRSTDAAVMVPVVVLAGGGRGRGRDERRWADGRPHALAASALPCCAAGQSPVAAPRRERACARTVPRDSPAVDHGRRDCRRARRRRARSAPGHHRHASREHTRVSTECRTATTRRSTTWRATPTLDLPCDPPYDWGSETWYLEERAHPGTGIRAATRGRAFAVRHGTCPSRR